MYEEELDAANRILAGQYSLYSQQAGIDRYLVAEAFIKLVQSICDHDWEVVDDSFDHEYGTEVILYEHCIKCDFDRPYEPVQFDDDVL